VKTVCSAARSATLCLRSEDRYLSTLSKQGQALLAALEVIFAGQPFYLALG